MGILAYNPGLVYTHNNMKNSFHGSVFPGGV